MSSGLVVRFQRRLKARKMRLAAALLEVSSLRKLVNPLIKLVNPLAEKNEEFQSKVGNPKNSV